VDGSQPLVSCCQDTDEIFGALKAMSCGLAEQLS
jgi:hypothetical protein